MLAVGITGLAQAGKSTLFRALTSMSGEQAGGRRLPLARVPVPDERLDKLSAIFKPAKTTPEYIDFLDMPGGAGGGLGSEAVAELRAVTVLAEVVRCFPHPYLGDPSPTRDMESFELEELLADLKVVEGRLERAKKLDPQEREVLEALQAPLAAGDPAALPPLTEEQRKRISGLGLLCLKPRLYVANVAEADLARPSPWEEEVRAFAARRGTTSLAICAQVEAELSELAPEERQEFLAALGVAEPGLNRLIRACNEKLGLLTFFTAGEKEVRAWKTRRGARAPEAAGEIHSDLQRGFIRAEVIDVDTFLACGSMQAAKERGLLRIEGKDYVVQDGDILTIRFNV